MKSSELESSGSDSYILVMIADTAFYISSGFALYVVAGCAFFLFVFLRYLPDLVADGLDASVRFGARVVRPGASEEQVNNWQGLFLGYSLVLAWLGFILLLSKGVIFLFL